MTEEEDRKRIEGYVSSSYKCKCGHTVYIPPCMDYSKCRWCGRRVDKSKRVIDLAFKERIKKYFMMRKVREDKHENK